MNGSELSRRYARALADAAPDEDALRRVRRELEVLAGALAESPGFRRLVDTAERSRQQKAALFDRVGESLGLSPLTRRLLRLLARHRRAGLLPALVQAFGLEVDRRLGVERAELISAVPLSEPQRQRIAEGLERALGAKVALNEQVDESLIGGYQLRTPGRTFDGSVRGRLRQIRERIAHGG